MNKVRTLMDESIGGLGGMEGSLVDAVIVWPPGARVALSMS